MMKLPRWLMIGMLTSSVLLPLAAAGWWWVTWPERTAREFVDLVAEDQFDEATEMSKNENFEALMLLSILTTRHEKWRASTLIVDSRSLGDVICCRQHFTMPDAAYGFTVARGAIVGQGFDFHSPNHPEHGDYNWDSIGLGFPKRDDGSEEQ